MCRLQEWVKHKGLRVIIVFEGRDAAGKGGTIRALTERVSPARVSGGGPARAIGPREVADVHAALHAALPRRGRGRDFRSQLVQPRRRRTRDGVLHHRSSTSASSNSVPLPRNTSSKAAFSSSKSGSKSATRNRSAASRRASKIRCASGSSARWTCPRAASGSNTPAPAT